jgi:hypothetical protein
VGDNIKIGCTAGTGIMQFRTGPVASPSEEGNTHTVSLQWLQLSA